MVKVTAALLAGMLMFTGSMGAPVTIGEEGGDKLTVETGEKTGGQTKVTFTYHQADALKQGESVFGICAAKNSGAGNGSEEDTKSGDHAFGVSLTCYANECSEGNYPWPALQGSKLGDGDDEDEDSDDHTWAAGGKDFGHANRGVMRNADGQGFHTTYMLSDAELSELGLAGDISSAEWRCWSTFNADSQETAINGEIDLSSWNTLTTWNGSGDDNGGDDNGGDDNGGDDNGDGGDDNGDGGDDNGNTCSIEQEEQALEDAINNLYQALSDCGRHASISIDIDFDGDGNADMHKDNHGNDGEEEDNTGSD